MIDVRPFMPGDLQNLRVQRQQAEELASHRDAPVGQAWTFLVNAEPICCSGLIELWAGRAYAWALLSERAGPHMLALTREMRSGFIRTPFARIEMAVDANFAQGRRWAELLGFNCETPQPMRHYLPNGHDAYLYARIA